MKSAAISKINASSSSSGSSSCLQVAWTTGEADAVVLTRLKNASVIHGFHEEKVVVHMTVTRADTPGGTVSAANFDGREEEVQVRLAVEMLPPKVRPTTLGVANRDTWGMLGVCLGIQPSR